MKNIIIIPLLLLNLCGFGQTATVSSNFEDQTFAPEIGLANFETGTSGGYFLVPNPHPDAINSSDYVLKVFTEPGTGGRAEYSIPRMETVEKTYIYSWKRYYPVGFWKDVDRWFCLQNQWKTWPCESGGHGDYATYDNLICTGSGIFNDMEFFKEGRLDYRSRAYPDCKWDYDTLTEGNWHKFTLEIYWTNSDNGYYRIWRNDTLFGYANNFKTLFDDFLESSCNIYWTTGLYTGWAKTGDMTQDSLIAYLDDIAIYDADSSFTINDVCPACETVPGTSTGIIPCKTNISNIFPNPVNDNLFIEGETIPLNITIYSYDGRKVKYAENTNVVNISDLKKGGYIVIVNMQESFTTIKIIKE